MKSFSIFYVTLVGGVRKSLFTFVRHSWTLLGPLWSFFPFWALLGSFGPFLGPFVMKNLFEMFRHYYITIVGVVVRKSLFIFIRPWVGPLLELFAHFGPFWPFFCLLWALFGPICYEEPF